MSGSGGELRFVTTWHQSDHNDVQYRVNGSRESRMVRPRGKLGSRRRASASFAAGFGCLMSTAYLGPDDLLPVPLDAG